MSVKIYNGYILDKDYSLRELDEIMTRIKTQMQPIAQNTFYRKVLSEFLYIFDCYTIFGKETALKRMNAYSETPLTELNWRSIMFRIARGVNEKIINAKISSKRDFEYDYSSMVQILPIENKILLLYYGENDVFLNIFEEQPEISEYHYQNQTDKPEDISDIDWIRRDYDWKQAILGGVPSNHGFSVDFINTEIFSFPTVDTFVDENIDVDLDTRASLVAYDFEYPCENFTFSTLCSDEYILFMMEKKKEVKEKLVRYEDVSAFLKELFETKKQEKEGDD